MHQPGPPKSERASCSVRTTFKSTHSPTIIQERRTWQTNGRSWTTVHLSEQFEVVIVQINHLWKSVHYRFPTRTRQAKNKGDSKYTIRWYPKPAWLPTISLCCLSSLNRHRVTKMGGRWDPWIGRGSGIGKRKVMEWRSQTICNGNECHGHQQTN